MRYVAHMTTAMNGGGTAVPEFTVHDRLRRAREFAGLEQIELAERIYVSRGTVSNYERNSHGRGMREIVLRSWAMACGVSYDWIMTGAVKPQRNGPSGVSVPSAGVEPATNCLNAPDRADKTVRPFRSRSAA